MHPLRLSVPFKKWAIPGHFFVFSYFQTNNTIHTTVKQCPSSKRCWDSNPWRFEHESLRITTRPRLPPDWVFFATANKRVSSIGSQQQQQQKQQKMKKFSLKRAFKHSHVTYLLTYNMFNMLLQWREGHWLHIYCWTNSISPSVTNYKQNLQKYKLTKIVVFICTVFVYKTFYYNCKIYELTFITIVKLFNKYAPRVTKPEAEMAFKKVLKNWLCLQFVQLLRNEEARN